VTKKDLVMAVCTAGKCSQTESTEIVETVLELMKEAFAQGEEVKITGFGKFEVKAKADRIGRNPQTGEEITIASRKILTWRPSNMLKAKVNESLGI